MLKLIDDAITATSASSGASSGSGTSSRCSDFRGSFSSDGTPANISCSSARTTAPRYDGREREGAELLGGRSVDDRVADRRSISVMAGDGTIQGNSPNLSGVVMPGSVIVSSARTPIGKLSGALSSFEATDLGGHAIAAALARAGITGDQVDYVLLGQVLQAGAGQMPARQAAVKGGIPMSVPSMTINKVCLSGINAIYLADQMIQAGDAEIVVAGGMESMTKAPYLLKKAREGYRMGNGELLDSMIDDGLWCAFDAVHMGAGTERYTGEIGGITRDMQDDVAAKSHERAAVAMKEGRLAEEIAPIEIPQRKGDPILVDTDEGVRPGTTAESLGQPAPRVRQGRHHHRRQRVADLRRRRRDRRHVGGQGRGSSGSHRSPSW